MIEFNEMNTIGKRENMIWYVFQYLSTTKLTYDACDQPAKSTTIPCVKQKFMVVIGLS